MLYKMTDAYIIIKVWSHSHMRRLEPGCALSSDKRLE